MKKKIVKALLIVLLIAAIVAVHKRVRFEEQERERSAEATQAVDAVEGETAEAIAIPRWDEEVTLGRVEENTEQGGINIIITAEDGTETVHSFTDVKPDSWYLDAVNYVVSAGLMNGANNKPKFMPDYAIQREFFALLLYRYTKSDVGDMTNPYQDVPEKIWFRDAVTWATGKDIMKPISDAKFGVGMNMTCEQAIVCFYRLAGEPKTDGSLADYPYASKVSEFGRGAMDWAWKTGLLSEEKKECVWYPPQAISRAQVAFLLMKLNEKNS